MSAKRGLFWCINGKLLCFPLSADETEEGNNNHKRVWKTLLRAQTGGKPYNYYPRGRVELRRGKAIVFLPPELCTPQVQAKIKQAFSLPDAMPISFKADGSRHYRCTSNEG